MARREFWLAAQRGELTKGAFVRRHSVLGCEDFLV
jgi:hypothetical protein